MVITTLVYGTESLLEELQVTKLHFANSECKEIAGILQRLFERLPFHVVTAISSFITRVIRRVIEIVIIICKECAKLYGKKTGDVVSQQGYLNMTIIKEGDTWFIITQFLGTTGKRFFFKK